MTAQGVRGLGERRIRVTVHNADGVNPYGTEIAALLAGVGHEVVLVDASNGEHRPPAAVTWRRLLPANFGRRSRLRQAWRLLRGLSTTVRAGAVRGDVVLVASVQRPVENVALAALAACGRPVVHVQHDPKRRVAESRFSRWSRRQILRRATVAVVHAERLRSDLPAGAFQRLVVCPHPPYSVAAPLAAAGASGEPDGRRWFAYIGTLRADKGIDLLPEILALVPDDERQRLGLVICGRGALSAGAWKRISDLGVAVRDMTSLEPVPHATLLTVLSEKPVVIAPYVAATQSGSVILALTMGCRVLAFDQGGIPDVVTPEGLVPNGDLAAMAEAVTAGRSGGSRLGVDDWRAAAAEAWSDTVVLAATCAGRKLRTSSRG